MKLRVIKEGRKFFPEKQVLGLWHRFEQDLDPYYRETIYFFDLEKAIQFCQSQLEDEQEPSVVWSHG